jgi:glycosyltransferase involved in cell wall biosynthesis
MNVLQINKFHFRKGGADQYYFQLSELLRSRGHPVLHFSMKDDRNEPSPCQEYFVSGVDLRHPSSHIGKIVTAGRIIYSVEARRNITALIRKHRPDIAHAHNIYHQLSPSILHALNRLGVPVVMTVHDYKLICPSYLLYNPKKKAVCTKCEGGRYYRAINSECVQGSRFKGMVLTAEMYIHRLLHSYDILYRLITPSIFMKEKLVDAGFPEEKLVHISNYIDTLPGDSSDNDGEYIAYLGRLSGEKGVHTLIDAVSELPEVPVKIAGDGPERKELEDRCRARGADHVSFLGHLSPERVKSVIAGASLVVVPSECNENCPMIVLESMSHGKPVVGSHIGGIPELIDHGRDGFHFEPGNSEDLRNTIERLVKDRGLVKIMGKRARKKIEQRYLKESHYRRIMEIYRGAVS